MNEPQEEQIFRYVSEVDERGVTVLRPLTEEDRVGLEGLKKAKAVRIGDTLEETQECPAEPDLPYGLGVCGIEGERDPVKQEARRLARQVWQEGDTELAERLLQVLDEEG